jgi:hypothetical protein
MCRRIAPSQAKSAAFETLGPGEPFIGGLANAAPGRRRTFRANPVRSDLHPRGGRPAATVKVQRATIESPPTLYCPGKHRLAGVGMAAVIRFGRSPGRAKMIDVGPSNSTLHSLVLSRRAAGNQAGIHT